jgi:hypothetical protein
MSFDPALIARRCLRRLAVWPLGLAQALGLATGMAWSAAPAASAAGPAPAASAAAPAETTAAPTGTGQRIYERTRPLLLQVRTLLKTQDSQSSVGSGFLVDDGGPAHHQLPRGQPVRAAAQPPPAGLCHGGRPPGRAAVAGLRRGARPGPAQAGGPRAAGRPRRRAPAARPTSPWPAVRASSPGQPAGCGLCGGRGQLQRAGGTQLPAPRCSSAARSAPA